MTEEIAMVSALYAPPSLSWIFVGETSPSLTRNSMTARCFTFQCEIHDPDCFPYIQNRNSKCLKKSSAKLWQAPDLGRKKRICTFYINTSKTPFGRRTSERESEPCTCRRVRGYFQLACARHPTSRSLAVCQIWRQSTRPFLRSGSGTLRVRTCKLGPK